MAEPVPRAPEPISAGSLLVRLPNWVGDVVIAQVILDELERAGFEVSLAGRSWCDDLLAAYPAPRVVVTRDHLSAARRLRTLGTRQGMLLTRSFGSALEMRLAGVRAVGYRSQGRSPLLYRTLRRQPGDHLVEYYWRIGRLACTTFGGDPSAFTHPPGRPVLRLTAEHRAAAEAAIEAAGLQPPYQVWSPLATNTIHGRSKVWPCFRELSARIDGSVPPVVCCPGPGQDGEVREAVPSARILPGLGLGAMAAVMERAALVLANDTGPMHVAAGVGAPVLGLFGPGNTPQRSGPLGGRTMGGGDRWPTPDEVESALRSMLARVAR